MRTILALLLAAPGAALAASGCADLSGGPINFGVDWQTQVKPIIKLELGGYCTGCHTGSAPAGGLDLSDEGGDAIYKIVGDVAIPGDPWNSRLFLKTDCTTPDQGAQMPKDGTPLSLEQRALIYDWIMQGAYGEDPFFPIYRDFIFRDGAESERR